MKKIFELLLFDIDGTLFDYNKSEKSALSDTYNRFEIAESLETFLTLYKEENSRIWREFENNQISAEELKAERFKRLFERIKININPRRFSEEYLDNLSQKTFLIDGAEELLKTLHKDFILVLITNGLTQVQKRRLSLSNLEKYFQSVIISEEVGSAKPDNGIFDAALDSVNHTNKKSTIIIGDSLNSDILGGINYGISTCWYNPTLLDIPENIKPDYIIKNLIEIKNII